MILPEDDVDQILESIQELIWEQGSITRLDDSEIENIVENVTEEVGTILNADH